MIYPRLVLLAEIRDISTQARGLIYWLPDDLSIVVLKLLDQWFPEAEPTRNAGAILQVDEAVIIDYYPYVVMVCDGDGAR